MRRKSIPKKVQKIGQVYLQHEFRKIFGDVKDEKVWKKLDKSMETFLKREGEESFWGLLFGISESWKLKYVAHILSDDKYEWKLQKFPLSEVTLTGMSPVMDEYIIKKCERDPMHFAKEWKKSAVMRRKIRTTGFSAHKERDMHPVLLFEKEGKTQVFDGMRRTLLAVIRGDEKIEAWVGCEKNKKGKPLISVSRCLFLADVLKLTRKDQNLNKAVLKIAKEVTKNFRNGKKAFKKRIAGWSHDENVKKTFKKL